MSLLLNKIFNNSQFYYAINYSVSDLHLVDDVNRESFIHLDILLIMTIILHLGVLIY